MDDKKLILETLNNPDKYSLIINKYQKQLLLYIQRVLFLNLNDSEDVLQETFIKAYRNLNSYNFDYKFSSWLFRIAHNECINYMRKNGKYLSNVDNQIEHDVFEEIASNIDLEKEVIERESSKKIMQVLSSLDAKYKEVLVLRYLEEKDYEEISDILHLPVGTVGSLISRAKAKFKVLFEQ